MGADGDLLKWFATLGVGGILGAFMFIFYRKDVKQFTELWQIQSGILIQVVKENTASNTKLIMVIEALQGRMDRVGRADRATDHPPLPPSTII